MDSGETARPGIPLEALPARWQSSRATLRLAAPAGLDLGPAFPGRVRGAWGQALLAEASPEAAAGKPCPRVPPCLLDRLFGEQEALTSGLRLPKPWVLSHDPLGIEPDGSVILDLHLTLFGRAAAWMDDALPALRRGLAAGLWTPTGPPLALTPRDQHVTAETGLLPPDTEGGRPVTAAVLCFRTPVVQRQGKRTGIDPVSLITGIGNRVSGMARWMDLSIGADWPALKARAAALDADLSSLRPIRWDRHSGRQGGRRIPMDGLLGEILLTGMITPLLPLLILGTQVHAGAHTAMGLGRYDLDFVLAEEG